MGNKSLDLAKTVRIESVLNEYTEHGSCMWNLQDFFNYKIIIMNNLYLFYCTVYRSFILIQYALNLLTLTHK